MELQRELMELAAAASVSAEKSLIDKAAGFVRSIGSLPFVSTSYMRAIGLDLACKVTGVGCNRHGLLRHVRLQFASTNADEYRRQLTLCKSSLGLKLSVQSTQQFLRIFLPENIYSRLEDLMAQFTGYFSALPPHRQKLLGLHPDEPPVWCAAAVIAAETAKFVVKKDQLCDSADMTIEMLRSSVESLRKILKSCEEEPPQADRPRQHSVAKSALKQQSSSLSSASTPASAKAQLPAAPIFPFSTPTGLADVSAKAASVLPPPIPAATSSSQSHDRLQDQKRRAYESWLCQLNEQR